jgi:uncharacterized membrane protein
MPRFSKRKHIAGIVVGILLTLAPLFGSLPAVTYMGRSFVAMQQSQPAPPPDFSLVPTMIGVILCPFGLIILVVSIVLYFRRRSQWRLPEATPTI